MEPFEGSTAVPPAATPLGRAARLWPPLALVGLFWGVIIALRVLDAPISTSFVTTMLSSIVLTAAFGLWWIFNRSIDRGERLFSPLVFLICAIITGLLADPSVGVLGVIYLGLPITLTAWAVWLLVSKRWSHGARRTGFVAIMVVLWGSFLSTRVDGIDGNNNATVSLRWKPSAEDLYVKSRKNSASEAAGQWSGPVVLQPGDWPDFRGPDRLGQWHGPAIATDWSAQPPKELWRRKIGPAWSSVLIVDRRLYTQEQRGQSEALVALDAATGNELWTHEDKVRFSDGQAGAGPRATPMFADGNIYSFGATGVLNCVDAATGKLQWTRDVAAENKSPMPMWGFSSSPLVADGLVVVFAGAPPDKGLAAYDAATGKPAWTAATGAISYSSPQSATIDGQKQILFFSDQGLIGVEPATGKMLWSYDAPQSGIWRVDQPRPLDDKTILLGCEDLGLLRLEVARQDDAWTPNETWRSRSIRPAYNDFVVADGCVYGFDEAIFCCVDAATGKRRWKAGRYGHGQVLLLADQKLLAVVTETGEVVLLKASPDKHEELGRFQAVSGKTWNHPVIAHGRLYVRNDQEMACFDVSTAEAPQAAAAPSATRAIADR